MSPTSASVSNVTLQCPCLDWPVQCHRACGRHSHMTPVRLHTPSDAAARSSQPKHASSVQPATGERPPRETLATEVHVPSASSPRARVAERSWVLFSHTWPTSATRQHLCNYWCQSQENTRLCFQVFIAYAGLTLRNIVLLPINKANPNSMAQSGNKSSSIFSRFSGYNHPFNPLLTWGGAGDEQHRAALFCEGRPRTAPHDDFAQSQPWGGLRHSQGVLTYSKWAKLSECRNVTKINKLAHCYCLCKSFN